MRTYIVLERSAGDGHWLELGRFEAGGATEAVQVARNAQPEETEGTPEDLLYVAVPERNWTELRGEVETPEPVFKLTPTRPPRKRQSKPASEPQAGQAELGEETKE